jgi:hypothetical protein
MSITAMHKQQIAPPPISQRSVEHLPMTDVVAPLE